MSINSTMKMASLKSPLLQDADYDAMNYEDTRRAGDRRITISEGNVHYENDNPDESPFSDNFVYTSKYTVWNFIPLNLWEQFHNLANIYFLLVGVLQMIPAVTTTNGVPSMYQPLAFILFVSALRAAKEDSLKHAVDKERNNEQYEVLERDGWTPIASGEIAVGDIIKIEQDKMIPADIVCVGSALEKGHCYIDKANLNGETTLEVLSSINATRHLCRNEKALLQCGLELTWEAPNAKFENFRGELVVVNGQKQERVSLDIKSMVMRETTLRNTPFIIGLVVYTGSETKIQMSSLEGSPAALEKKSRIMRMVDRFLLIMLAVQSLLCILAGSISGYWSVMWGQDSWYLGMEDSSFVYEAFLSFFTWFILLSHMVPISLIVSAEMVKFIQSIFINWDRVLFYQPIDKPAKCNSSLIHEDLGLVDFIFSDKTGTLTQNKMEFRYALLAHGKFGSAETEISKSVKTKQEELKRRRELMEDGGDAPVYQKPRAKPWTALNKPLLLGPDPVGNRCCDKLPVNMWNQPLEDDGNGADADPGEADSNKFTEEQRQELLRALWGGEQGKDEALYRYMVHMALSNTVKPYEDDATGELNFQAESAEELAMSKFAQSCGFVKRSQNPTVLEVQEYDRDLEPTRLVTYKYNHVATLGFTSKRARVSVIYQNAETRGISVMTKGQDTVILPLLHRCDNEDQLMMDLKQLCVNGLRTLVCGYAELPEEWWTERQAKYTEVVKADETEFSKGHSSGKCVQGKCEKCAKHNAFAKFEKDAKLTYLGCIGMEDRLQLLVPETIQDYLQAGIKVWMITGDKLETAKNIGLACNLIDPDMEPTFEDNADLETCVSAFQASRLLHVTGQWASLADDEEELRKLFQTLDVDHSGKISYKELQTCLDALQFGLSADKLRELFDQQMDQDGMLDKKSFVALMRSTELSMYEAVKYDLEESIRRYMSIDDHAMYPVSMLVNRSAFQVMFPPKEHNDSGNKNGNSDDDVQEADDNRKNDGPSEADLEALRERFFLLASVTKSVVFARAEPAMKKRMVTEIMARVPDATTLAIGDGANDTDMITAAHVGVGIAGVEGTAATNAADYALGTFNKLHTLLLVHGFWNYHRVAFLVHFIFYKALVIALTTYFFGVYSGFSGQQFFNDLPYQLYNVCFTALPVLAVGILDKKVPRDVLENNPMIFREAKGLAFRRRDFSQWVFRAVLHSIIIFWVPVFVMGPASITGPEGRIGGLWYLSTIVFYCNVLLPSLFVMFDMASITILHVMTVVLSVVALLLLTFLFGLLLSYNPDLYGVIPEMLKQPQTWLIMLISLGVPILLELAYRYVRLQFRPSFTNIVQERLLIKKGQMKAMIASRNGGGYNVQDLAAVEPPSESLVQVGEYQEAWVGRKHKTTRVNLDKVHSEKLASMAPLGAEEKKEVAHMRSTIVRAMLRFRNLTGSQFDSSAQSQWQDHDAPLGQEEQKEE